MMNPAKLMAFGTVLLTTAALAQPGQVPSQGQTPQQARPAQPAPPEPQPVAAVNGEPILDSELQARLQAQVQGRNVPPETMAQLREHALDGLIQSRLIEQFAREEGPDVDRDEVDQTLSRLEDQLQAQGVRLDDYLRSQGQTEETLRDRVEASLAWQKFIAEQATEERLRDHFENNKTEFDGTQVRARHILIQVPPSANEQEQQAARSKLDGIRKFLDEGGDFADIAGVHSDDQATARQGGDLGYFPRHGQILKPVAEAAFDLEPGEVSEPVRSPLGVHRIQVVDRKEGDRDFAEARQEVANAFVAGLWEQIISERRPDAEIRVARPQQREQPAEQPLPNGFPQQQR